jgi:hypothetical protein
MFLIFSVTFAKENLDNCKKGLESRIVQLISDDNKVAGKAAQDILKCAEELNVGIVRLAMSRAGEVEDWRSNPFLIQILEEKGKYENGKFGGFDATTRALSALVMGEIVGGRGFSEEGQDEEEKKVSNNVVNALIDGLDKEEEIRVRLASAQALGDTFSHRAVEPLRAIAEDESEDAMLRVVALRSLTKILSNPGTERVTLSEELVNGAIAEGMMRFGNLINLLPPQE